MLPLLRSCQDKRNIPPTLINLAIVLLCVRQTGHHCERVNGLGLVPNPHPPRESSARHYRTTTWLALSLWIDVPWAELSYTCNRIQGKKLRLGKGRGLYRCGGGGVVAGEIKKIAGGFLPPLDVNICVYICASGSM